jgi:hypothetical protein
MQFRLKSLFGVIFLVAVGCGVFVALPNWLCCIVLGAVALVSPAAIVTGIVYGRGARRAFAISCLASGGWAIWLTPYFIAQALSGGLDTIMDIEPEEAMMIKIVFLACYGALALSGLVGVGVRRLLYQGRNRIRPPRDCC